MSTDTEQDPTASGLSRKKLDDFAAVLDGTCAEIEELPALAGCADGSVDADKLNDDLIDIGMERCDGCDAWGFAETFPEVGTCEDCAEDDDDYDDD